VPRSIQSNTPKLTLLIDTPPSPIPGKSADTLTISPYDG
jgi:hypothetical protein